MKETSLKKRPWDLFFIVFFVINLLFVTYIIDLETLIISNPLKFTYPIWPPSFLVDLTHWWGRNFDPVLLARPVWWKATIWIDVLLFGPYYVAAIYAFIRAKEWIKIPTFIYSGLLFANVTIIMMEEMIGEHKTNKPFYVWIANLPWLIAPILLCLRMWIQKHPFLKKNKKKLK